MKHQSDIFAHRGGRKWAPENTMAAFSRSLKAGVDGIELDIHRCAGGELVVIHDDDIARTTNGVGLVKDVTYAELQRISAGLWFDPQFKEEHVPLLKDVLDLIDGQLILNIEIKNLPVDYSGIDDDLLELLQDYPHRDKLIISSFDHQIIRSISKKDPSLKLAVLADALLIDLADYAGKMGAQFWHPSFSSLREEAVAVAHEAGIKVNVWTVNSQRDWASAIKMGVDGIITDDPVGLKTYMEHMVAV